MSYGANEVDLFRRAADYVDKILKGAKPADIPVEQPTGDQPEDRQGVGIEVPLPLLTLADEVIE